jgi:hypothetical protein
MPKNHLVYYCHCRKHCSGIPCQVSQTTWCRCCECCWSDSQASVYVVQPDGRTTECKRKPNNRKRKAPGVAGESYLFLALCVTLLTPVTYIDAIGSRGEVYSNRPGQHGNQVGGVLHKHHLVSLGYRAIGDCGVYKYRIRVRQRRARAQSIHEDSRSPDTRLAEHTAFLSSISHSLIAARVHIAPCL